MAAPAKSESRRLRRRGPHAPGLSPYPASPAGRTRWILERRGPRASVNPRRPQAFFLEDERTESGAVATVATVLLTNRECPWHCLMCDLWKHTLATSTPPGAIPAQVAYALRQLRSRGGGQARQIKLYNSGSFFDPRAIPPPDWPALARQLSGFERVIVESHPALVGPLCLRFRDMLSQAGQAARPPVLEVALGLETAHPGVLARLNKRMPLSQFRRAADFLRRHGLALRVFILVQPPFLGQAAAGPWTRRSLEYAFDCGASVAVLIPTRPGNGALEALAERGQFRPPRQATLEAAVEYGVRLGRGRVLADLWDLDQFVDCPTCFPARRERLRRINLTQSLLPRIRCSRCASV